MQPSPPLCSSPEICEVKITKELKGTLILIITAFIWGTAFVAQTSAADTISAFTFNGVRGIIAAAALAAIAAIFDAVARKKGNDPSLSPKDRRRVIVGGICCGLALFVASNLQQFGIEVYPDGVAASGRAGFLTSVYVIMVAVVSRFSGKKLHPLVILAVFGCLAGMYLLCVSEGFSDIYLGDILLLLCAAGYTVHILVIDRFSGPGSVKMSCIQFALYGVISLICAFIFEEPSVSALAGAAIPILYAALLSSAAAYTLQIVGQKYASPAPAAIAMSLESVFAVLSGWLILNEQLSVRELIGCGLVFAAVITAQIPELIKKPAEVEWDG